MKKYINDQRGLSLLELMITLSLIVVVLSLAYMYFGFGVQAFERGEKLTIAQMGVRSASDFITSELRYANQIEINPENGLDETGFRYVYLDNDSIRFRNVDGSESYLANSYDDSIVYDIQFSSNVPDDVVIFTIDADNGFYTLNTRVQALNLELFREYNLELYGAVIKVNSGDNTIIKYKKPTDN